MRTVLVVGAAGKVGSRTSLQLARQGYKLVLIDINEKSLSRVAQDISPTQLERFVVDISDENQILALVKSLEERGISLGGIIVCSGIDHKVTQEGFNDIFLGPESFPLSQWNADMSSSLTGTFLVLKHLSKLLNTNSSIVLLGSDLSVISPNHRLYNLNTPTLKNFKPVSYSVVKAGLLGLSKYFAGYLAPRHIRVNVVSPGAIYDNQPEDFVQAITELIPMGKMGSFEDSINLICFLISEESSYITGQNILVDGGRTTW